MAHTDRDDARWFWKDHFRWVDGGNKHSGYQWGEGRCDCRSLPDSRAWINPYRHEQGIPSYYHKDCRRTERGKARNLMARAKAGHLDWDELVISYRRPYFW